MINNRPIELKPGSNNLIVYNIGYNIMVWIVSNKEIEQVERLTVDIIEKMCI